jgi:hypothetical protein
MEDRFEERRKVGDPDQFLTRAQITELIYKHDLPTLRSQVVEYLQHKEQVWVLFDNIDKGWIAHGVDESDLLNLRCLIEACSKLRRDLRKSKIPFQGVVSSYATTFTNCSLSRCRIAARSPKPLWTGQMPHYYGNCCGEDSLSAFLTKSRNLMSFGGA